MQFRPAELQDAALLFDWRNDAETRAASRNSAPVAWDVHLAWIADRLRRDNPHLYIAELDGVPVGTFRIDGDEISYAIAPAFRGRRLAVAMLRLVADNFGAKVARVKSTNPASARVAEAAGHRVEYLDE